jgi:uncharacterized RDD family membrane protein YckC
MSVPAAQGDTPLHSLVSPEGVRLELAVAGPAPRMFAYAADLVAIGLLLLLLLTLLFSGLRLENMLGKLFHSAAREAMSGGPGAGPHAQAQPFGTWDGVFLAIFVLLQSAIETGYFIFWEMVANGRSPGKILIRLRVIRRDGHPIDFRSSVIRNVMRIVDILPAYYGVGLISIVLSPSGERLGDHAAGTIVIRLDRPPSAPEIAEADTPALSLTREQLGRIGPREMQLLRSTLRRESGLEPERRQALLAEVAETIRSRLQLAQAPPDALAFLRDVLTLSERYSRTRPS